MMWCIQVAGKSYTDFSKETFDCGHYKPLCVIKGTPCNIKSPPPPTRTKRDLSDWDFWPEYPLKASGASGYFCAATVISDRWAVAAAHCYEGHGKFLTGRVRTNTVRDGTPFKEIVEVKRIYKHPLYSFPRLYNDIALLELGRRIEYDHDRFGDSPSCIDRNIEVADKVREAGLPISFISFSRSGRCKDTERKRMEAVGHCSKQQ